LIEIIVLVVAAAFAACFLRFAYEKYTEEDIEEDNYDDLDLDEFDEQQGPR
jgi:hypothetical protein